MSLFPATTMEPESLRRFGEAMVSDDSFAGRWRLSVKNPEELLHPRSVFF
jgi:hypothetical protein